MVVSGAWPYSKPVAPGPSTLSNQPKLGSESEMQGWAGPRTRTRTGTGTGTGNGTGTPLAPPMEPKGNPQSPKQSTPLPYCTVPGIQYNTGLDYAGTGTGTGRLELNWH